MYLQLHQAARVMPGIQNRQRADGGMGCPCSLFSERTAPGWDLSSLPDPRVNMGGLLDLSQPPPPNLAALFCQGLLV